MLALSWFFGTLDLDQFKSSKKLSVFWFFSILKNLGTNFKASYLNKFKPLLTLKTIYKSNAPCNWSLQHLKVRKSTLKERTGKWRFRPFARAFKRSVHHLFLQHKLFSDHFFCSLTAPCLFFAQRTRLKLRVSTIKSISFAFLSTVASAVNIQLFKSKVFTEECSAKSHLSKRSSASIPILFKLPVFLNEPPLKTMPSDHFWFKIRINCSHMINSTIELVNMRLCCRQNTSWR